MKSRGEQEQTSQDLPVWLNDPTLLDVMRRQGATDERCLTLVRRLRARPGAASRPDLDFRCSTGCLLFAGYDTQAGLLLYHPPGRASQKYLVGRQWTAKPGLRPEETESGWRFPERAHLLGPAARAVPAECRHISMLVDAGQLRAAAAQAVRTRQTIRVLLRPGVS